MLLVILPSTNVLGQTISDLFQQVEPAVVVIRTVERETSADPRQSVSFRSLGSGVLVSGDGRVLTASHVVQAADRVGVEFSTGHVSLARVLASVPSADIAVLQLQDPPPDVEPAVLADSDEMRIGEEVIVIGAPYGIARTLTVGHLSGRRAPGEVDNDQMMTAEFFQTDAAINTGNSGGPMLNLRGEVIGIVSHILTQGGGFEGLGFAVTSNSAQHLTWSLPR